MYLFFVSGCLSFFLPALQIIAGLVNAAAGLFG
jgi:hypothetical protein